MPGGILYVVATPIGNLEDITLRALRVLREVDLIAAEDTRHTRVLLSRHGISRPLTSYYDAVERARAPAIVEKLKAGARVALVSDAGTPGIADPGYHLVRGALAAGVPVVPVPGPSAVMALVSVAGLAAERFVFEGFLPSRPGPRAERLAALAREPRAIVFFEAVRRPSASRARGTTGVPWRSRGRERGEGRSDRHRPARDQAVADVVYGHPEALHRAYPEQLGIAGLREHDLVRRLKAFRSKNRVADVPSDNLPGCRGETALVPRNHADLPEFVLRKPRELRPCVHQHLHRWRSTILVLRVPCDDDD